MEEEYGRLVSYGEVFLRAHSKLDGSLLDKKAKTILENYEKALQDVMDQQLGDGPSLSDNTSENSTQRNITIEQKNAIFLKCTKKNKRGNPYGLGQIVDAIYTEKEKSRVPGAATLEVIKLQDKVEEQQRQLEAEKLRRKAVEDASETRIAEMERAIASLKAGTPPAATQTIGAPPAATQTTPPAAAHTTEPVVEQDESLTHLKL